MIRGPGVRYGNGGEGEVVLIIIVGGLQAIVIISVGCCLGAIFVSYL